MPLVTIILPTRDRPDVLPRAIASVLAQTEPDFELLIIDNGAAAPVQPSLWEHDSRVRVLWDRSIGNASQARNAGLDAATGEWTAFLDDDDAYRPRKLTEQLSLARSLSAPVVACGALLHLKGRMRPRLTHTNRVRGDALLGCVIGPPLLLHRRSEVRFAGDLRSGEDHPYLQALLAKHDLREVPVVPQPLVDVYQDVPARSRTNLQALEGWRASRRVWWEFGDRYSAAARRLYVLRSLLARAKLQGDVRRCARIAMALVHHAGPSELRTVANALAVASGLAPSRFVS